MRTSITRTIYLRSICLIGFFLIFPFISFAQPFSVLKKYLSDKESFVVEVVADRLSVVWGMVFINEHEMLLTERSGKIKKLNVQNGQVSLISGGPFVYRQGQGGLMDIALHPQFQKNRKIYLSYSKSKKDKQSTAVAMGVLKDNRILFLKDIFIAKPFVNSSRHFGSRLVFDQKGFLYLSVGDRAERAFAQKLDNHLGKILRLTDQGLHPSDNPFVLVKNAQPEIWSFGHRNIQGLYIHPKDQTLWSQEHGPKGGDEINLVQRGDNYGWPVITYGREYWGPKIGEGFKKEGMRQPIKYYTPSIAPSGLLIYSGKLFKNWKHHFFSGSLALRHLNRLVVQKQTSTQEQRLLSDLSFRVRSVIEGPKGLIYIGLDEGKILRLKPEK